MKMYIEVKDKNGKVFIVKMSTQDFMKTMSKMHGGAMSTIQDHIKNYNQNRDGNVASLVIEKNGKRLGEGMKLAEKYLKMKESKVSEAMKFSNGFEGGWTKNGYEWDKDGKFILFGRDGSVHTNDGYKMVKVPSKIMRALTGVDFQKEKRLVRVSVSDDLWTLVVNVLNGVSLGGTRDFEKFQEAGLFGVVCDSKEMVLHFKVK